MPEVTTNSEPAFDAAARSYDADFTETGTGKLQRELVHAYLAKTVLHGSELKVLELNCGTGEDAIWMAGKGAQVLATDLSGEMVRLGKEKWDSYRKNTGVGSGHGQAVPEASSEGSASGTVEFRQMDLRQAMELDTQFDLVFSNFGGLNCISPQEFSAFLDRLPDLLNPNGHFIAVIMPRFCAWETLYYMLKFRFRKAFRRMRQGPIPAPLGNDTFQDTWYYSPRQLRKWLSSSVTRIDIAPIGFFLPPSYLDPFFQKRPSWLKRLAKWEHKCAQRSSLASKADHFLISVQFLTNLTQ